MTFDELAQQLVDEWHPYVDDLLGCDGNCLEIPCPACDIADQELWMIVADVIEEDFGDVEIAREALAIDDDEWNEDPSPFGESQWGRAAHVAAQEESNENITVAPSQIHGWGLVARKALPKGYDIGILSIIFPSVFQDTAYGRYINHSEQPTADLYHVKTDEYIKVGGKLNRDIEEGEEITADYRDPLAPKPNYVDNFDPRKP